MSQIVRIGRKHRVNRLGITPTILGTNDLELVWDRFTVGKGSSPNAR